MNWLKKIYYKISEITQNKKYPNQIEMKKFLICVERLKNPKIMLKDKNSESGEALVNLN